MPRHIVRLVLIMVGFVLLAYGAKKFFTVDSFYQYGHYRGDSVAEIASDKPKYKGTAYCASCHAEQFATWSKGVHNSADIGKVVKCEVCHGPGGARDVGDVFQASATGPDHPQNMKMVVPADSRTLCTLCHERLTGRPVEQRQIVVADHAGTQQCTVCHNPHSPRLNLVSTVASRPADAALGKVKAAACAGCHGAEGVSVNLPGPTLAGQNEAYLVEAIKAYSTGARDNATMTAMVQGASADDVDNIASYFASQKCESALNPERQAASADRSTASKCVACHGANGVSTNRSWPNLMGQSRDYLVNTLKAYKDGTRKNGLMTGVAKNLSDADAESAAAYFVGAGCK
ncbi:MAG: c-type cytochrome [Bradyrhizobium sp.]|uniref:cytochrome c3 family protein n=1 Tax=Bradyrhizobium sp. TaxID=376 RepID=UPI00120F16BC|nr:cytochrome c3 family protein [Bradyrhizobium sp.]THD45591.1 MAG: c-type cytochrome [Bradyrhizobium sp.]